MYRDNERYLKTLDELRKTMILQEPKLETHEEFEEFFEKMSIVDTGKTFSNVKYKPYDEEFGDRVVFSLDKCKVIFDISKYNKLVVKINPKDLPIMQKFDERLHELNKHDLVNTYQSFLGKNGDALSLKVNKENPCYADIEKIRSGDIVCLTFSFSKCCKINKNTYASFELGTIEKK